MPSGAPQAQEASGTKMAASLAIPEEELDELEEELDEELEEEDELELDELDELARPDDELEEELEEELEDELLELEVLVAPPHPAKVTAAKNSIELRTIGFLGLVFIVADMWLHLNFRVVMKNCPA